MSTYIMINTTSTMVPLEIFEEIASYLPPSKVHSLIRLNRTCKSRFQNPSFNFALRNLRYHVVERKCPICRKDVNKTCMTSGMNELSESSPVCGTALMSLNWAKMAQNYISACISICDFCPKLFQVLFPAFLNHYVNDKDTLGGNMDSTKFFLYTRNLFSDEFFAASKTRIVFNVTFLTEALSKAVLSTNNYNLSHGNYAPIKWLSANGDLTTLQKLHSLSRLDKSAYQFALCESAMGGHQSIFDWLMGIVKLDETVVQFDQSDELTYGCYDAWKHYQKWKGIMDAELTDEERVIIETIRPREVDVGSLVLRLAGFNGNLDMFNALRERKDSVKPPPHEFADYGYSKNVEIVKTFLTSPFANPRLALRFAPNAHVMQLLLDDPRFGHNPHNDFNIFRIDVLSLRLDKVKLWVESGRVNPSDHGCVILEDLAYLPGGEKILKYLVGLELETMDVSVANNIAMYRAVLRGHVESLRLLMSHPSVKETLAPVWGNSWGNMMIADVFQGTDTETDDDEELDTVYDDNVDEGFVPSCFDAFMYMAIRLLEVTTDNRYLDIAKVLLESGRVNLGAMNCKVFRFAPNVDAARLLLETGKAVTKGMSPNVLGSAARLPLDLFKMTMEQGGFTEKDIPFDLCLGECERKGYWNTFEYLCKALCKSLSIPHMDYDWNQNVNDQISDDIINMLCITKQFSQKTIQERALLAVRIGSSSKTLSVLVKYIDNETFKKVLLRCCEYGAVSKLVVMYQHNRDLALSCTQEGLDIVNDSLNDSPQNQNFRRVGWGVDIELMLETVRYLSLQLQSKNGESGVDSRLFSWRCNR
ncbi:hypothetical protein HDU76_001507 [Blyttiomyces sp. JEL0837]|nr:hypothetical protein HDU76_001507 [Blyttiomyces sp. JEL0837]